MRDSNQKIFAEESRHYAQQTYWRADEEYVAEKYFVGKKLLVMGCGAGRTLLPLYKKGYHITAVDITPEMIKYARQRCAGLPIDIHEMDATKLTFQNKSFDTVFFPFHGIDFVEPDIYAAVKEAARVLKPEGVLVFNSHNRFYLKKLYRIFAGTYDVYDGLRLYRTSPFDTVKLRRYFSSVQVIQRISIINQKRANWKDKLYQLLPWLNKSTYFICRYPK